MLEHLGEAAAAAALMRAIERVAADGLPHADLGGRASTDQVMAAVIRTIRGDNKFAAAWGAL